MSRRKWIQMGRWQIFVFCLWMGILAGTFVGNQMETRVKQENDNAGWEIEDNQRNFLQNTFPWRKQAGSQEKFYFLCSRRLKEGALGWLLGVTVCAAFGFCLLAGYAGFLLGWTITVYTIELGVLGLPGFILSCFPQCLLYLPAWGLLVWQGLEGKAKIRLLPSLLAVLFLSGGAVLEAFVNPIFLLHGLVY